MRHVSRTHRVYLGWLLVRKNQFEFEHFCEIRSHQPTDRRHFITNGSFTRDEWNELIILFSNVSKSFHLGASSVVAALVPFADRIAGRSHFSMDEGASSKPNPKGIELSRWLQCDIRKAHH